MKPDIFGLVIALTALAVLAFMAIYTDSERRYWRDRALEFQSKWEDAQTDIAVMSGTIELLQERQDQAKGQGK